MCAAKSDSRQSAPQPAALRPLGFASIDAVAEDVDRLRCDGYVRLGNWDLARICEHLATLMRFSLEGFPFHFPWILRRVVGPLVIKPWMLRTRRFPSGVDAPKEMVPTGQLGEEQAVEAFKAMLWRVRDHRGEFQPSPLLGPLTPEQWRQIHMIHAAHHLRFLVPKNVSGHG